MLDEIGSGGAFAFAGPGDDLTRDIDQGDRGRARHQPVGGGRDGRRQRGAADRRIGGRIVERVGAILVATDRRDIEVLPGVLAGQHRGLVEAEGELHVGGGLARGEAAEGELDDIHHIPRDRARGGSDEQRRAGAVQRQGMQRAERAGMAGDRGRQRHRRDRKAGAEIGGRGQRRLVERVLRHEHVDERAIADAGGRRVAEADGLAEGVAEQNLGRQARERDARDRSVEHAMIGRQRVLRERQHRRDGAGGAFQGPVAAHRGGTGGIGGGGDADAEQIVQVGDEGRPGDAGAGVTPPDLHLGAIGEMVAPGGNFGAAGKQRGRIDRTGAERDLPGAAVGQHVDFIDLLHAAQGGADLAQPVLRRIEHHDASAFGNTGNQALPVCHAGIDEQHRGRGRGGGRHRRCGRGPLGQRRGHRIGGVIGCRGMRRRRVGHRFQRQREAGVKEKPWLQDLAHRCLLPEVVS